MSSYQPTTAVSAAPSMGNYGNARRAARNPVTAPPTTAAAAGGSTAALAAGSPGSGSNMSDSLNKNSAAAVTAASPRPDVTAPVTTATTTATTALAEGKSGSTDAVIEELKALAKSMLEATNAARRRTSSIEHRNSYEALMHAIENRVNSEAGPSGEGLTNAAGGSGSAGGGGGGANGMQPPQQQQQLHVDPNMTDMSESELLSAHLIEQLTDIPVELSPGSRVRQQQQLEQLQLQQQQIRKAAKGRNAAAAAVKQNTATAPPAESSKTVASQRAAVNAVRDDIPEDEVDVDEMEEAEEIAAPAPTQAQAKDAAVARRHGPSVEPPPPPPHHHDDDEDDDGTAYDGVRAQVLFKPVNRAAYHEVLASTWKPEGLTRKVPVERGTGKPGSGMGSSSNSGSSGSSSDSNSEEREEAADDDEDDEAMASVPTRNKARKASQQQEQQQQQPPTRAMKVYRVPAFPYGGGVTEQQARLLQRQFDACIQNGEHLHSNATGPRLITKEAFDSYTYDEVDVRTAQMDLKSFKPTSPYEFVVEVEREVRFDAVKAREERRRRFKRLVHENRAPATMGTFDLRIIMDPFKTGFEEEKNFPIIPGTVIAGRYEIIQMLGKATFSRAVRCYDLHDPIYDEVDDDAEGEGEDGSHRQDGDDDVDNGASASPADGKGLDERTGKAGSKTGPSKTRKLVGYGQVCLKIINNTKDFFDQSLDEIRLLTLLNRQRDPDEAHIVRLIDAFYYKEHVMLVTELLRDTLYDYGKYNREEEEEFYFTVPRLRRLTRQIVEALTYVHSLNLIHTDLKPENIMFVSYSRCIVKVIDFGSSCFLSDHLSSYIQSRSYRAPEVVLGCDYDGRIDVWSLGAILVEMVTGDVLFTSDTVPEMLARIVYVCGTPFPRHMLWEGRHTSDYINKFGCIYEYGGTGDEQRERGGVNDSKGEEDGEEPYCLYTPVPTMAPHTCNAPKKSRASTSSRTPAGPFSVLREKLAAANMVDKDFLSFVEACLTLDHKKRPTTAQLLDHPFIKNERI